MQCLPFGALRSFLFGALNCQQGSGLLELMSLRRQNDVILGKRVGIALLRSEKAV